MIRGTTYEIIFRLPFDTSEITKLNIAFAQEGQVILEKNMNTSFLEDNYVRVSLTEAETLLFNSLKPVEVQVRLAIDECVMASQIISLPVDRILKDGILE